MTLAVKYCGGCNPHYDRVKKEGSDVQNKSQKEVVDDKMATTHEGVWAGRDAVTGAATRSVA